MESASSMTMPSLLVLTPVRLALNAQPRHLLGSVAILSNLHPISLLAHAVQRGVACLQQEGALPNCSFLDGLKQRLARKLCFKLRLVLIGGRCACQASPFSETGQTFLAGRLHAWLQKTPGPPWWLRNAVAMTCLKPDGTSVSVCTQISVNQPLDS